MISKLSTNDYEKGGITAHLSNCFKLTYRIYQGNPKLETSPLKKNQKNWSHIFNQYGMSEIKQEEFYGIIEGTYCDLINNSTSNDTNFTYQKVKNVADIYKKGEITKNITIPYRGRSRKLKDAYIEEYGCECQLCNKSYLKPNNEGYIIDIHHLKPIAKGERGTSIKDVKGLCPNCHRFVHSINDFENKSWDEIKEIFNNIYKNH